MGFLRLDRLRRSPDPRRPRKDRHRGHLFRLLDQREGKIAFIWGAGSIIAAAWAFFVLPELKGRTLEELDELFQKRVNVFEFGRYQTTGAGATLAVIEGMAHTVDDKTAELVVQEKGLDRKEGSM